MGSAGTEDVSEPSGGGIASRSNSRNQFVEWVLVDGNRLLLTLAISGVVFASLVVSYQLDIIDFTNDDSITRMASGMIAGSFSLVTIVVSVNQLILSQEFSSAGEFEDRFEDVLEFKRGVEDATGVPAAPIAPTPILELLAADIRYRASALADAIDGHDDRADRERITRFARRVETETDRIDETLDTGGVSVFDALRAAIRYDDAWQFYAARHLRNDTPSLSPEAERAFDRLLDGLRLFSTAQAHFKTVYLERELTRFSQLTVYCGAPAIGAPVLIALLYGGLGGATIQLTYHPYVISLLVTVVFVPVGLLISYILRTATLTRRTAATGPVLPQLDPDDEPFEVSYGEWNSD